MDPNNPGQTPGGPTPDPWAQPQPPAQPQYPEQPAGQTPYGAPPAQPQGWAPPAPGYDPAQQQYPQQPYGQPPYPQQPYGQPPYPQQPWGAAPVAQPQKSKLPKILAVVVAIVVGLIVLGVVASMLLPSHAGKVIFTTDSPTTEGAKTCSLGTEVTTVKIGDPVYINVFYKKRLSGESVTLTILKDGVVQDTESLSSAESNGIDCLEYQQNLASFLDSPGSWEFKLTDSHGNVVSDGILTVTP
jgi:hypothetical protein